MKLYRHRSTGKLVTALCFDYPVTSDVLNWCPCLVSSYRDKNGRAVGVILQTSGKEHRQSVSENDWIVKDKNTFYVVPNHSFLHQYQPE